MLYLPATFVCSLFGTNFFVLKMSTDNESASFVVSDVWWINVVSAFPLTALTMGVWLCWMKQRVKQDREKKIKDEKVGEV